MKNIKILYLCLVLGTWMSCKNDEKKVVIERIVKNPSEAADDTLAGIVDDFYKALSARDSAAVLSFFAEDSRLLGSDPLENWDRLGISKYMQSIAADTIRKVSIEVQKRDVRLVNEFMVVTDLIHISTVNIPFRCVSIIDWELNKRKIMLSEFSALVSNEHLLQVDSLFYRDAKVH